MPRWITDQPELLTVLVNLGMLAVWVVYLQIFLSGFLRQRRPNILMNRSLAGPSEVHCLVSNMSAEAIYVTSLIASVETEGECWRYPVTEELREEHGEGTATTRQGPLAPAAYRDIGSLRRFTEQVLKQAGTSLDERRTYVLELLLVAQYASEYLPVAARRRFRVRRDGGRWRFTPETIRTEQIRSRRERRRIEAIVENDLG